jgi:hypothetical protein
VKTISALNHCYWRLRIFGFFWFTIEQYLGIVTNPDMMINGVNVADASVLEWQVLEPGLSFSATMLVSLDGHHRPMFVAVFLSQNRRGSPCRWARRRSKKTRPLSPSRCSPPSSTSLRLLVYLGIAYLLHQPAPG